MYTQHDLIRQQHRMSGVEGKRDAQMRAVSAEVDKNQLNSFYSHPFSD